MITIRSITEHKTGFAIFVIFMVTWIAFIAYHIMTLESMCSELYSVAQDYESTYGHPISYYPKSCLGPHANPLGAFQRG